MRKIKIRNTILTSLATLATNARFNEQKTKQKYHFDLCSAMVKSNIPLNKLQISLLRQFLEKYCQKSITLRKTYASPVSDETMQQIKNNVANNYI